MTRSPPAWSLSVRLGWRLAAVMLLAILLAGGAIGWRAIATVHDLDDLALQEQARIIAAALPRDGDARGPLDVPDAVVAPFRASDGDNVFLVYGTDGLAATSDPAAAAIVAPRLPHRPRHGFFRVPAFHGHPHGMIGLLTSAGPWRIIVLQGRNQSAVLLDSLMGSFLLAAVWLLLPLGAAMVLVGVVTLRRGLRPLRRVSAAAALVGPARPGARLPAEGLPGEIAPLVGAVNDALARLEQALEAQRRFVAEAAHALRTPLAVLTARLDMLDEQPGVEALRGDADRMGRLVGQLPLDVSAPVDLRAVAVEAIAALVPLGLRRGVEIALSETEAVPPTTGNPAALVLALTNLIENALAHAPAGSVVEVRITRPAIIAVLDRGPGVPSAHRQRIFGRFERGPSPRDGGAGLGLAIVAEIAAAHGGAVSVTDRRGGGAAFVLRLGAAAAPPRPVPLRPVRPERSSPSAAAVDQNTTSP